MSRPVEISTGTTPTDWVNRSSCVPLSVNSYIKTAIFRAMMRIVTQGNDLRRGLSLIGITSAPFRTRFGAPENPSAILTMRAGMRALTRHRAHGNPLFGRVGHEELHG